MSLRSISDRYIYVLWGDAMRGIEVVVGKGGKVVIRYYGFVGDACFEEASRLYQKLKEKGVDVAIEQVIPTEEYYASSTSQEAREVERVG